MPRSIRIEFPGAFYHVMARGNRREPIYADDEDRRYFLKTLGEACAMTGWRVHAWALMGNHYHLVIETPEPNLVAGMQWLQNTYTRRFNVRHRLPPQPSPLRSQERGVGFPISVPRRSMGYRLWSWKAMLRLIAS